jgi:hypothetical protein
MSINDGGVDVLAGGISSMYWAGSSAYQSGLTLAANPWDGNNPSEARANWAWRKGFASAENAARARALDRALARIQPAAKEKS